jgi:TPR repeat protein
LKEYYQMNYLEKNFNNPKKILRILLFIICTISPTFASLQKGESLMVQGKFDEAIATLSPDAAKQNPHALYLLGCIYLSSKSGHLNYSKGIDLLEKAISLNYAPAFDEYAGLLLVGEGVEKNEQKALNYYVQAAHMGYGPSQFNAGIMYKEGQGTTKEPVKAYLYLCLASLNYRDLDTVTEDAAKYRDEVVPLLTREQRQEALSQVNALTLPKNSRKDVR